MENKAEKSVQSEQLYFKENDSISIHMPTDINPGKFLPRTKIFPNTVEIQKVLERLPKLYIVCQWAKWTTLSAPFSHFEKDKNGILVPYVYRYRDANGMADEWVLGNYRTMTSGAIAAYTFSEEQAKILAEKLNK